jgi:UDP-N-acetylglucosamine--N-acetylmuramyl-(pentapeptide) pyrophosphoryl-undecaprenol N-acetylglucosamine transferase
MDTLLVAAAGGHLSELVRLRPRLGLVDPPVWVTSDSEQARTLLRGERVVHAREVTPRDYATLARNLPLARTLMARGAERVISTGAGIALSFLPLARAHGVDAHYIESAARTQGPSLTGRLLARVPGVKLYGQYESWAGGRWRYAGSVYDGFEPGTARAPGGPLKVALALGTMQFPFPRLVDRVNAVLPEDAQAVLWQTGSTPLDGGAVAGRASVSPEELRQAFREADVVIAHAGVGTALEALDAGRTPILVPRLRRFREHVDDHQVQVAEELAGRGLALLRHAEDLTAGDLHEAARGSVQAVSNPPAIALA